MIRNLVLLFLALVASCRPSYPICEGDADCRPHGEWCFHGQCQACRDDAHCGECSVCGAGRCAVVPGCCGSDADCAYGQRCRDRRCGPECASAADCGSGAVCAGGRCAPDVECLGIADCPAGMACRGGRCEDVEAPPAAAAAGCPSDLPAAHFDFDRATIRPDAATALQVVARCAGGPVVVEGHCDERGTTEYNLALGDRRARAAAAYLRRAGLEVARTVSYGEARPADPGHDEAAWQANRRAEVRHRTGGGGR